MGWFRSSRDEVRSQMLGNLVRSGQVDAETARGWNGSDADFDAIQNRVAGVSAPSPVGDADSARFSEWGTRTGLLVEPYDQGQVELGSPTLGWS